LPPKLPVISSFNVSEVFTVEQLPVVSTVSPPTSITQSVTHISARERIVEIINTFEKKKITLESDKILQTVVISQNVSEDPDQTDEGETVYRGDAIIEFMISKGV